MNDNQRKILERCTNIIGWWLEHPNASDKDCVDYLASQDIKILYCNYNGMMKVVRSHIKVALGDVHRD